jgi:hypothetical protein
MCRASCLRLTLMFATSTADAWAEGYCSDVSKWVSGAQRLVITKEPFCEMLEV